MCLFLRRKEFCFLETKQKKTGKRRAGRTVGMVILTLVLIVLTCTAICGMVFAVYINKYVSQDVEIYLDSYRLNLTSFLY